MSSDNLFPFKKSDEVEEAVRQRKELTDRIYHAILPMLGPEQSQELLKFINARLGPGLKPNLQPVVDQQCEVCQSPMKIDEQGDKHYVTSCIRCGYMDVLEK